MCFNVHLIWSYNLPAPRCSSNECHEQILARCVVNRPMISYFVCCRHIRTSSRLPAKTKPSLVARYLQRGVTSFLLWTLDISSSLIQDNSQVGVKIHTSVPLSVMSSLIICKYLFLAIKEILINIFYCVFLSDFMVWYTHHNELYGLLWTVKSVCRKSSKSFEFRLNINILGKLEFTARSEVKPISVSPFTALAADITVCTLDTLEAVDAHHTWLPRGTRGHTILTLTRAHHTCLVPRLQGTTLVTGGPSPILGL